MASIFIPATAIILLLVCVSPAPTIAGIVKDAEGEMLQNGRPYYILPYEPDTLGTGGLSWTPNNSSSCPLFVKPKSYSHGTPVSISTLILPTFVPTSYPVFITFLAMNTPCTEELRWSVTPSEATDKFFVTAGQAGASESFVSGQFRIEEADKEKNEYNIKFCHVYESFIVLKCADVGFLENGLLGITPKKPVPFRFVKAFSDLRMPVRA